MSDFTPRPWTVRPTPAGSFNIVADVGACLRARSVARISTFERHGLPFGDEAADAHLIAAAPDLYEALEELQQSCSTHREDMVKVPAPEVVWRARAALAKARGE